MYSTEYSTVLIFYHLIHCAVVLFCIVFYCVLHCIGSLEHCTALSLFDYYCFVYNYYTSKKYYWINNYNYMSMDCAWSKAQTWIYMYIYSVITCFSKAFCSVFNILAKSSICLSLWKSWNNCSSIWESTWSKHIVYIIANKQHKRKLSINDAKIV